MKKGTTTPILLLVLGILLAFPAAAGEPEEATLDVLISTIESNKKALIAVNLGLDDEESFGYPQRRLVADRLECVCGMADDLPVDVPEAIERQRIPGIGQPHEGQAVGLAH